MRYIISLIIVTVIFSLIISVCARNTLAQVKKINASQFANIENNEEGKNQGF